MIQTSIYSSNVPVLYTANTSSSFTFAIPLGMVNPDVFGGAALELLGTQPGFNFNKYGATTLTSPSGASVTGTGWNIKGGLGSDVIIDAASSLAISREIYANRGGNIALTVAVGNDFAISSTSPVHASMTIAMLVINVNEPTPTPTLSGLHLTLDAHRRPAVGGGASSVTGYVSRDAGHTYLPTTIDGSGKDASLLIDTRQNRFRVVYSTGTSGLMLATGMLGDAFTQDAGSPSALKTPAGALLSGAFPVACPHPTDKDYVLLVYAAGTSLTPAYSMDAGTSWSVAAASVATADLTKSGRPALAFSGNSAALVYGNGNSLYAALSKDRGMTWQTPTIVTGTGSYQSLSLLGWQGRLYLLAFTVPAAGGTPTPVLFTSPDLGATWAQVSSTFPAITPPSGIGVVPSTGTLRLGLTHFSGDDGHTWTAA